MRKLILTAIFLCASASAFAGDKILNGGNAVVCKDPQGQITSVEMLDSWELRQNGGALFLDASKPTYKEKLEALFDRWQVVAPVRTKDYRTWLQSFESEALFLSGVDIPGIPDTGPIAVPRGCAIEPVAYQVADSEVLPGRKRFTINKDLWNQMNEEQKAVLVLHELVYREGIQAKHNSSFQTRYFVGVLLSPTLDSEAYLHAVVGSKLMFVEYRGAIIELVRWCNPNDPRDCSEVPPFQYNSSKINSDVYIRGFYSDVTLPGFSLKGIGPGTTGIVLKYGNDLLLEISYWGSRLNVVEAIVSCFSHGGGKAHGIYKFVAKSNASQLLSNLQCGNVDFSEGDSWFYEASVFANAQIVTEGELTFGPDSVSGYFGRPKEEDVFLIHNWDTRYYYLPVWGGNHQMPDRIIDTVASKTFFKRKVGPPITDVQAIKIRYDTIQTLVVQGGEWHRTTDGDWKFVSSSKP